MIRCSNVMVPASHDTLRHNGDEKENAEDYEMNQALEYGGAGGPECDH